MVLEWTLILGTSISMSLDCMSVNAANAICDISIKKWKLILFSFLFGIMHIIMGSIGYFLCSLVKDKIEAYIPWIGFSLLMILAIKELVEWIVDTVKRKKGEDDLKPKKITWAVFIVEAIATSIDVLCIGISFVYLPTWEAMVFFCIIALAVFILSSIGAIFGKYLARILKNWAGLITALVFIAVALDILLSGIL